MHHATHFIGFREGGCRWWAAVRAFGQPDFVHRVWDARAVAEVMPGDRAVFACPERIRAHAYDDSAHQ